jgi:hypothetical protein
MLIRAVGDSMIANSENQVMAWIYEDNPSERQARRSRFQRMTHSEFQSLESCAQESGKRVCSLERGGTGEKCLRVSAVLNQGMLSFPADYV